VYPGDYYIYLDGSYVSCMEMNDYILHDWMVVSASVASVVNCSSTRLPIDGFAYISKEGLHTHTRVLICFFDKCAFGLRKSILQGMCLMANQLSSLCMHGTSLQNTISS
jgi:hypothetical protein